MKIFLSWHNNTDVKFSCKYPFEDLFIRVSNSEEGQMAAILTERVWPPPSLRKSENKNEPEKADMNHGGFLWYLALYTKPKCNSTNKLYK